MIRFVANALGLFLGFTVISSVFILDVQMPWWMYWGIVIVAFIQIIKTISNLFQNLEDA